MAKTERKLLSPLGRKTLDLINQDREAIYRQASQDVFDAMARRVVPLTDEALASIKHLEKVAVAAAKRAGRGETTRRNHDRLIVRLQENNIARED